MDFVIIDDLRDMTKMLFKPASDRKTVCYDRPVMWRYAVAYLIEDAGDEAEASTKRQNMTITEEGGKVWCMKINLCLKQIKLIFFKKETLI